MNEVRQAWIVAAREIRERLRSPVYYVSLLLMVLSVASFVLLPALLDSGTAPRDVALSGASPAGLGSAIEAQGKAVDVDIRVHRYGSVRDGERAVRDGKMDVLVVGADRLEWRRTADEELEAVVTGAIQVLAIQGRAATAGIAPGTLSGLVAPVPVKSVELSPVAGRSADDTTATYVLSLVLFLSVSIYGGMVLAGVVEEKSSRVVEVLLARIPSRSLLAGKVAGIGLLGLGQVVITGAAALVAIAFSDFAEIPAARGEVIVWAVVWFVLGYALIATAYGVLGSLTSRSEDASSVTGPLTVVLVVAYFVSFAAIGSPDSTWARLASWFPVTAPFTMPNRIAMGAAGWWEPFVAAALTVAAVIGLVRLGGRVYRHAILHTGGIVRLGDAWRGTTRGAADAGARVRLLLGVLAVGVGLTAGVVAGDVVLGVTVGALGVAAISRSRLHRPRGGWADRPH